MASEYLEFENFLPDEFVLSEKDISEKSCEIRDLLCLDLDTICAKYGNPEVTSKVSKYGNGDLSIADPANKAHKFVCIPHKTDPLRLTIRKVPKHKTMRVGRKWVV